MRIEDEENRFGNVRPRFLLEAFEEGENMLIG